MRDTRPAHVFFTPVCCCGRPTTVNSWKVWPIASFISFNYVPAELRVLFVNVVAFFWVIILSGIAARK
jgi:peroxisomal membrane protein 2